MARFRNITDAPLEVREFQAEAVEPDGLIEVPGDVVDETEDAVIVRGDVGDRAWPKATWADATPAKTASREKKER